jgi:hypothetical protein
VGIGLEKKNGAYTGEVCVTVGVEEKVPLSTLEPEDIVPFELSGVVVDIIEDDIPTPANDSLANPGNNNELQTKVRNTAISPLAGGVAGNGGSFGTFPGSARLQDEDGNFVSITNRHIACEQDEDCTGDPLFQPRINKQSSRFVGAVKELGPFNANGPAEDNIDVATIIHNENQVNLSNRYFGLGEQIDFAEPELERRIVNAGARTGFTSGFINGVDISVSVAFQPQSIPFTGLVRYESDGITAGGDSGSIVGYVKPNGDLQPVANNFAGTSTSGFGMPFGKIQSFFGPLTTPSGTYSIPTSASSINLLEVAVWRMKEDIQTGDAILKYFVSNTGGQTITDTVEVRDGSNVIASRTHSQVQPGTFEFDSFSIPQQFFQDTLVIRTSDHVDSVLIDPPILDIVVGQNRVQANGQALQATASIDIGTGGETQMFGTVIPAEDTATASNVGISSLSASSVQTASLSSVDEGDTSIISNVTSSTLTVDTTASSSETNVTANISQSSLTPTNDIEITSAISIVSPQTSTASTLVVEDEDTFVADVPSLVDASGSERSVNANTISVDTPTLSATSSVTQESTDVSTASEEAIVFVSADTPTAAISITPSSIVSTSDVVSQSAIDASISTDDVFPETATFTSRTANAATVSTDEKIATPISVTIEGAVDASAAADTPTTASSIVSSIGSTKDIEINSAIDTGTIPTAIVSIVTTQDEQTITNEQPTITALVVSTEVSADSSGLLDGGNALVSDSGIVGTAVASVNPIDANTIVSDNGIEDSAISIRQPNGEAIAQNVDIVESVDATTPPTDASSSVTDGNDITTVSGASATSQTITVNTSAQDEDVVAVSDVTPLQSNDNIEIASATSPIDPQTSVAGVIVSADEQTTATDTTLQSNTRVTITQIDAETSALDSAGTRGVAAEVVGGVGESASLDAGSRAAASVLGGVPTGVAFAADAPSVSGVESVPVGGAGDGERSSASGDPSRALVGVSGAPSPFEGAAAVDLPSVPPAQIASFPIDAQTIAQVGNVLSTLSAQTLPGVGEADDVDVTSALAVFSPQTIDATPAFSTDEDTTALDGGALSTLHGDDILVDANTSAADPATIQTIAARTVERNVSESPPLEPATATTTTAAESILLLPLHVTAVEVDQRVALGSLEIASAVSTIVPTVAITVPIVVGGGGATSTEEDAAAGINIVSIASTSGFENIVGKDEQTGGTVSDIDAPTSGVSFADTSTSRAVTESGTSSANTYDA